VTAGAADPVVHEVPAVDAPPETQPVAWRHRHLLDVDALTRPELELVMGTTDAMAEVLARPIPKPLRDAMQADKDVLPARE
jgi:hypothetical protein